MCVHMISNYCNYSIALHVRDVCLLQFTEAVKPREGRNVGRAVNII